MKKNELPYHEQSFKFSDSQLEDKNKISIFTEMKLYEDERLTYNESGLTIPWDVAEFTKESPIFSVTMRYVTGNEPGLDVKLKRALEERP